MLHSLDLLFKKNFSCSSVSFSMYSQFEFAVCFFGSSQVSCDIFGITVHTQSSGDRRRWILNSISRNACYEIFTTDKVGIGVAACEAEDEGT